MASVSQTVLNDVSVTVRDDTIEIIAPTRYKIIVNGKPIDRPPRPTGPQKE